jgi:hypothetical protein
MASKYEDRTVEELKEVARDRGLAVSGSKDELIARLRGEDVEAKAPEPEVASEPEAEAPEEEFVPEPFDVSGNFKGDSRLMTELKAHQGDEEAQAALARMEAKEQATADREKAALAAEEVRRSAGL